MKFFAFLAVMSILAVPPQTCNSKKEDPKLYKAKLETKALCMNYTLRLTEGSLDTSMIAASWTDENTGKTYTNAFALGNPCTFPSTIQQGDEFYFVIDTASAQQQCAVCMAYYPTPPKKLLIKVINK